MNNLSTLVKEAHDILNQWAETLSDGDHSKIYSNLEKGGKMFIQVASNPGELQEPPEVRIGIQTSDKKFYYLAQLKLAQLQ